MKIEFDRPPCNTYPYVLTSRLLSSKSLTPASRKFTNVTLSALTVRRCCPKDSAMSARILVCKAKKREHLMFDTMSGCHRDLRPSKCGLMLTQHAMQVR